MAFSGSREHRLVPIVEHRINRIVNRQSPMARIEGARRIFPIVPIDVLCKWRFAEVDQQNPQGIDGLYELPVCQCPVPR